MPTCVVKPTMADVNKVVEGLSLTRQSYTPYCDLADTNRQMVEADQKNQEKVRQELSVKVDPFAGIPWSRVRGIDDWS